MGRIVQVDGVETIMMSYEGCSTVFRSFDLSSYLWSSSVVDLTSRNMSMRQL